MGQPLKAHQQNGMSVVPSERAIIAAQEGATLPMFDGSEWRIKRAGQNFLKISLTQTPHFGNHENTSDDLRSSNLP